MIAMIALVVKATVILAAALVAARMARRGRASLRHLLLAAPFAALLLLPIAAVWLPALTVRVPVEQASLTSSLPSALTDGARVAPGMTVPAQTASEPAQTGGARGRWTPLVASNPLLALWMAGVLIFVVPVLAGFWQMRRLRRDGLPWLRAGALADEIARKAGVARRVEILCHEALAGPMTCGVLRPVIMLPREARAWTDDDLRRALTHELAHIRRADWLVLTLARTVCACYWFHPLVWMAWRQLRLETERASDDVVLRGADATRYAEQLVTLAERMTLLPARVQTLLGMASRNDLSTRVRAVLDITQRRGAAGRYSAVGTTIGVVAIVAFLGPLHLVAVAQSQPQSVSARPTFEVASIRPNTSDAFNPFANVQSLPGGRVDAVNVTLQQLIGFAFALTERYQFQALEENAQFRNLLNARFDVLARAPGDVPIAGRSEVGPLNLMMQSLLAERFGLVVRWEDRPHDAYVLGRRQPDGPLGPRLRPSSDLDCSLPVSERPPGKTQRCFSSTINGEMSADGQEMSDFVRTLSMMLDSPVIDRTGLSGPFALQMTFDHADLPMARRMGVIPPGVPPGPSIFVAVQEQLGLRLERERLALPVPIVVQVEPPTEN